MASSLVAPRGGIRFRLTALYVAVFGATLVLFASILFRQFLSNEENQFDIALYNHAVDIGEGVSFDIFGHLVVTSETLSAGGKIFPFSVGNTFVQIATPEGGILARSSNLGQASLPVDTEELAALPQTRISFRNLTRQQVGRPNQERHLTLRMLTTLRPGSIELGRKTFVLQVAVPTTFLEQATDGLRRFLIVSIPLILLAATFAGLYLARRALAPVSAIIEKAKGIRPTQLGERIPVPASDDEIRQLALTLNQLLDRLQRAFEGQDRFIADASHELKTPLAILRGELDVLRSRPREKEELEQFLGSAAQELQHLSRVVEDLLTLARADSGSQHLAMQALRIDELLLEVISRLEIMARARGVKIRLDLLGQPEFGFRGDPDLLRALFKNLIENAIKYSPSGQSVEVRLERKGSDRGALIQVSVSDHGPGIPEDRLPHIFERFYRIEDGSSPIADTVTAGAGLGLSIAQKISDVHGGKLEAQSELGKGSTLIVSFPGIEPRS